MLEKLGWEGSRIFDVCLSKDKKLLELQKACDFYYATDLTKAQVIELANDFLKLADEMVET